MLSLQCAATNEFPILLHRRKEAAFGALCWRTAQLFQGPQCRKTCGVFLRCSAPKCIALARISCHHTPMVKLDRRRFLCRCRVSNATISTTSVSSGVRAVRRSYGIGPRVLPGAMRSQPFDALRKRLASSRSQKPYFRRRKVIASSADCPTSIEAPWAWRWSSTPAGTSAPPSVWRLGSDTTGATRSCGARAFRQHARSHARTVEGPPVLVRL